MLQEVAVRGRQRSGPARLVVGKAIEVAAAWPAVAGLVAFGSVAVLCGVAFLFATDASDRAAGRNGWD